MLVTAKPKAHTDSGFNEQVLQATERAANCQDQEPIGFLTYGCYDYSPNKPPISWFDQHRTSVFKKWTAFAEAWQKKYG